MKYISNFEYVSMYVKIFIENYFIINRKFITYVFKNINWYSYQIIVHKENPFLISKRPALKKNVIKNSQFVCHDILIVVCHSNLYIHVKKHPFINILINKKRYGIDNRRCRETNSLTCSSFVSIS